MVNEFAKNPSLHPPLYFYEHYLYRLRRDPIWGSIPHIHIFRTIKPKAAFKSNLRLKKVTFVSRAKSEQLAARTIQ